MGPHRPGRAGGAVRCGCCHPDGPATAAPRGPAGPRSGLGSPRWARAGGPGPVRDRSRRLPRDSMKYGPWHGLPRSGQGSGIVRVRLCGPCHGPHCDSVGDIPCRADTRARALTRMRPRARSRTDAHALARAHALERARWDERARACAHALARARLHPHERTCTHARTSHALSHKRLHARKHALARACTHARTCTHALTLTRANLHTHPEHARTRARTQSNTRTHARTHLRALTLARTPSHARAH